MHGLALVLVKLVVPAALGALALIALVSGDQLLGIAAIISSLATLLVAIRTFREVKTINSKSLANLADEHAAREERDIPAAERTQEEAGHLKAVDDKAKEDTKQGG